MSRPIIVSNHHRKAARAFVREGMPLPAALRHAGYSRKQSWKNWNLVFRVAGLRLAIERELQNFAKEQEWIPNV